MNGRPLTSESRYRNASGESPSIFLTCGEMGTICGRVCRFVTSLTGEVNGFILDRGLHVCFSADLSDRVMEILSIGSQVSVDGCVRVNHVGDTCLDATTITSLDSRRSVEFDRAPLPRAPAMPSVTASPKRDTAPPASFEWSDSETRLEAKPHRNQPARAVDFAVATNESWSPAVRSPEDSPTYDSPGAESPRGAPADGIDLALNGLHRTEVLLAYLFVVNAKGPRGGQHLFDEALRTYEQALARAGVRDYTAAREFASASRFLSRAADILILRMMPWNGNHPSRAPSCQNAVEMLNAATLAEDQLQRVEGLLSRIRLLVNGDRASTSDCAQVQKLVLRGATLHGQARCFVYDGRIEDAIELAHAAEAVARSAEHLCRASELLQDTNAG